MIRGLCVVLTAGTVEKREQVRSSGLATVRTIFGIDLRTLALFRVLLGSYLIADLCLRARDLVAHYSDAGIVPRDFQTAHLSASSWSLHLINGSPLFQAMLMLIAGGAALGMIVGWRTRLMSVISWILLISLHNRNTFILSGEDILALLLLFWSLFLPLGARYSVDAAMDKAQRKTANLYFSIFTLALLVQGMSMYFFSALMKSDPKWFPEGLAVYYALQLDYFVTPLALWFRQFESLLQGLTYYVFALELVGPLLIFSPVLHRSLRVALMFAFITMHIGFALFLEIGLFPVISIIMNLTFMPSWMWDKLAGSPRFSNQPHLTIWYDRDCGFCLKMCHLLKIFLILRNVTIRPAQEDAEIGRILTENNSWVVSTSSEQALKWSALGLLVKASPVFSPIQGVMKFSFAVRLGDRIYDAVARNRYGLSKLTNVILPWRNLRTTSSLWLQCVGASFLAFITVQNVSTVPQFGLSLSREFVQLRQALGLYQNWTMFAPHPELTSPWPVIEGQLKNGEIVDVYNGRTGPASQKKPDVVSAVYANYRWRKYLSLLEDQTYESVPQTLALHYGRYLCGQWNSQHSGDRQLSHFSIVFKVETTPPPDVPKVVEERKVWSHNCLG